MRQHLKKWSGYFIKFLKLFFPALLLVLLLRGFFLIPVPVDGHSMADTLEQGDMILMEKFSAVQRFDVIVFQLPNGSIYIKRVIGLPGDQIRYEDDQLYIDDEAVAEPFLTKNQAIDQASEPYTTNFELVDLIGSMQLGADQYFVLGDNRRMSKDSRSFGAVDAQYILGKARVVYYPVTKIKWIGQN